MEKVEHIGIAVKNLEESNALFSQIFNTKPYKTEEVRSEKVRTSFFQIGKTKIELLEAMDHSGPIQKFLDNKGEGIHHVAFEVKNIKDEMKRMSGLGYTLLSEEPKLGADNKLVCFLHPKTTNGVMIELCQEIVN